MIDITTKTTTVNTANDSLIIVNNLETLPGGRSLDVTGFTDTEISAGHLIIKKITDSTYKPLPKDGTLPSGYAYVGVLVASLKTAKATASIMTRGTVNEAYLKYAVSSTAKTALSLIQFIKV